MRRFCFVKCRLRVAVAVVGLAIVVAGPPVAAGDFDRIDQRVREWLTLRREWNQVRADWKVQRELLEEELQVLRQQKAELEKAATDQRAKLAGLESRFEAAAREKKVQETALAGLSAPLLANEAHLRSWQEKLPGFLNRHLATGFGKLPPADLVHGDERKAERLQLVFGLYSQLEHLNSVVHLEREILSEGSGSGQEMELIFFGISQGYALSLDGNSAAIGRMTDNGLHWTWRDDLAGSLMDVKAFYKKEKPAAFVSLPLQIELETEEQ
jgi:hypothetical protein